MYVCQKMDSEIAACELESCDERWEAHGRPHGESGHIVILIFAAVSTSQRAYN